MKKLIAMMALVAGVANAGEFKTQCMAQTREINYLCSDAISDLVTDKFLKKYPLSRGYQIVIISSVSRHSVGASSFAVATVGHYDNSNYILPRIGASRFTSTSKTNNALSDKELVELEFSTVRNAVKNLMDDCEYGSCNDLYQNRVESKKGGV